MILVIFFGNLMLPKFMARDVEWSFHPSSDTPRSLSFPRVRVEFTERGEGTLGEEVCPGQVSTFRAEGLPGPTYPRPP